MRSINLLIGLLFCFSVMGQTPIPTDVYLSFPLDGNAIDISGYNYSGTMIGGVTATTDRYGNASGALQFDGSSGYIDIPDNTSIGTLDFSVSYWANPNAANAGFVFSKEQSGVPTNQFRMGSTGDYFGCFSDNTMTYGGGLPYTPTANVWSFYTITRQGGSIKLYVNGVYQSDLTTAGTINHSNTLNYRIGTVYSSSIYFNGKIDDLRMFQHALSTNEINALYTAGNPPVITSFTPVTGTIGTSVTITGTGFSETPANNIVYFGAVKATVSASTTTSITVTVPAGAGSIVPVSVTVDGAMAFSTTCSTPTFTLTNSPNLSLIYQKTDMAAGGTGPISVAVGDFNGDGNADMATANTSSNNISVLLGTGTGSYATAVNYPAGTFPISLAVGDFNGDGNLDLATANINSNNVSVLLGSGDGTFGIQATYSTGDGPRSVAVGDFNRDGKADLTVANSYANNVSVLLGNGTGGFAAAATFTTGTGPISVTVGDFNADGKADMATANYNTNDVSVLIGNGTGGFATAVNHTVGTQPTSIAVGDLNGDGKNDLAVSNKIPGNVSVLMGSGTGTFATAVSFPVGAIPHYVAIGDFNGDGKTDLATSNVLANDISILLGNGVGGFAAAISFPVGSEPYSMAVGDFNGDGKADLVAANLASNTISILLNATIGITTQATTAIGSTTATGNGNLLDLGLMNTTAYGVCWNTTGTPTISNSKVDLGAASATGPFTASMTDLLPNTMYFVRAYATNTSGTYYGEVQSFSTVPFQITSFSPASGPAGTNVTITGTGFSTAPASNIVYIGAVKATVTASTTTSITVTVPAGAGSVVPVTVTVDGAVAFSTTSTTPTFTLTYLPIISLVYVKDDVAVGNNPYAVATGDFNGDGKADMASANQSSNDVSILSGDGLGGFGAAVNYTVGTSPQSVTVGDFNGDGNLDLATANYSSNNVSILLGNGNGTFMAAVSYPVAQTPRMVAVGDFNGDGKVDLVTGNYLSYNVSILLGIGNGTFAARSDFWLGFRITSVAVGDFNSDGKADLATTNYNHNSVNIWLGNGAGTFTPTVSYPVASLPQSLAVGDFNGDGKADLAVANQTSLNVSVLLGNGNGTFASAVNYSTGSNPYSVVVGDFNGDGIADLSTSNVYQYSFSVSILMGDGNGTFMDFFAYPLESITYSVAAGDFNGDGKVDLATTNYNLNSVSVLLNAAIRVTTQVTDISVITATGNGTITDFGILNQASAHGVCWKKTGIPIALDNHVELGSLADTGTFSASMTGLTYSTTYYVRAYAINTAGTSYGDVVSFTTLPHSPLKITSFTPVTGTIGTTVNITGVGFSTIPSENIVYFGAVKASVTASTTTSLTVTVPAGAGSVVPVSVTVQGALAYSTTSSTPTFTLTNLPNLSLVYGRTDVAVGGNSPHSVAIADFNGDGNADMATANYGSNNVGIMLGNGNGGFAAAVGYAVGNPPRSVTVGDFNGDGKPDLCTASTETSVVSIILGIGDGTFAPAVNCFAPSPESVAVGDFNGDGKADLVCNNYADGVDILIGNGDGTFASVANYSLGSFSRSVTIGDFNRDGKTDLAATNNANNVSILIGNGNGGFAAAVSYPVGDSPQSITIGDFNDDGKADIAAANRNSNNVSVLLGNGSNGFAAAVNYPVGSWPNSVAVGDFNGDGNTDLIIANIESSNLSILAGNGTGGFATALDYAAVSNPISVAVGDFNRDGKADLFTANFWANNASVMLNASIGITSQAITEISSTTATGNGNLVDLGVLNTTNYGVCWNTTGTPTISDNKVEKGAATATGPFTASITGLATNTKYYVRAFATNSAYTGYGNEVNFTTLQPPLLKITSFAPVSGPVGTTIILTGLGFSTNPSENIVYVGAVRATVSASTATSITLTIPAGAGSVVPVSVTVNGAIAYSTTSSTPTFNLTNTPNLDLVYRKTDVAAGGNNPISTAIGDFNSDGKADLATANAASNSVSILLGDGNGGFASPSNYLVSITPRSLVVGDFNSDGKADLATAHFGSNAVSILIGNGNGGFAPAVNYASGSGGHSISVDDFNGDQKADLITTNYNLNTVSVLLGNGNGGFAAPVQYMAGSNPISVAVGDFNKDTRADLAIADYGSGNVSIMQGDGNGSFATADQYSVGMNPWSVAIGDFNQDGNADLAVANSGSNTVSVLPGTGTGSFGTALDYPTGTSPIFTSVSDFNGDGKADLAVANNSSNDISLLIGNGTGGFASPVNFQSGSSPYAVAIGDFNGDGKADLATANSASNNVTVLINVKLIVSTQAVSSINETTATGNGNIIELGIPNPTAYGVCWNTTGTPTISDSKVDKGAASASGPFTVAMNGLAINTHYYVRAFATNIAGTSYGNEVSFATHGTYTWSGASSGDWDNSANWLSNEIPGNPDDVIIPSSVANWPVFTGDFVLGSNCKNLTLNAGSQLSINGNITLNNGFTLNNNGLVKVGGNWINNRDASYNTGNGTVEFFGTSSSSVAPFVGATSYKINDNFNTFPGNWLGDIGTDEAQFRQITGYNAGGSSPEIMVENYGNLPGINTRRLYQVVNTTGLNALIFQFKQTLFIASEAFTIKVEYSTNGTTWNDAGWSITPTEDIYSQNVNINLTSNQGVGSATYYISITVTLNSGSSFYWYIDDVKLMYNDQNETFYNLTVNKTMPSGGVNLNGNATITGTLTLANGLLNLGSNNLLLGANTLIAGTPSATSMVVATGSGQLYKAFTSPGSFTFPVGDDTGTPEYSPVSLDFTSGTFGTDAYAAVKLVNTPLNGTTTNYLNRYWNVAATGITGFTCNAGFNYLAADVTGNEASLMCVQSQPPDFTVHGAANTILHQLTATGISSFGDFSGEGNSTNKTVTLTSIFPEGLCNGGGTLRQAMNGSGIQWPIGVADHITVELHDAANYSSIAFSASDIELSTTGSATLSVPAAHSGLYYITIRHRNSIQVTSSLPITFAGNSISKSFATPGEVFGGNLKPISSMGFALYAGDVNQDGVVDALDLIPCDNAANYSLTGYYPADVNGDGIVDINDIIMIQVNCALFASVRIP